jgi:hypothetical protein
MSTEQVIMESQNLNSVSFAENESMPAEVTNRSNGRRIGFLRRKIVELQAELDTLLALEPVKVSKIGKGRPKSVKKLSPEQQADDDLFANLVDEMWSETTPDVKKFNAPVEVEEEQEELVVSETAVVSKAPAKKEKKHSLTEEEKEAKKAALAEEKKLKKEADKAAKKALKKSEGAKKAAATRAANKLALKAAATANDSDNESVASESAPVLSEVVAPVVSKAATEVVSKAPASKEKKAPVLSEAKSKAATEVVSEAKSKAATEVVVEVKPTKVTVSRITIGDIKYLKSNTNVLYNPDTREEVGMYDAETNSVKPLPDNEDDEMSEDEYESEEE